MPVIIAFLAVAVSFDGAPERKAPAPLIVEPQLSDYPVVALAAKEQGDVSIVLHLGVDDSLNCTVSTKRAPVSLLRPSCSLVVQRWVFAGKINAQGHPEETVIPLIVRWQIPKKKSPATFDYGGATPISPASWIRSEDYPIEAIRYDLDGKVRIAFDITPGGRITNCIVELPADFEPFNEVACRLTMARGLLLPAIGKDGRPKRTKGFKTINFAIPR